MASCLLLPNLSTKKDIDRAIKGSEDKVVVLRFGRIDDGVCMQLDDIVSTISILELVCPCWQISIFINAIERGRG